MKSIKTIIAAMLVATATTAGAQTTNYVHIIKTDGTKIELSQTEIQSLTIDTEAPVTPIQDYVEFTYSDSKVRVATMNMGATTVAESAATSYGDYYAWGATEPFGTVAFSSYSTGTVTPTAGHEGGYNETNAPFAVGNTYYKYTSLDGKTTLEASDDAVKQHASWGAGWHMPTQAEFQTLYNACGGSFSGSLEGTLVSYPVTGVYWVKGSKTAAGVKIGDDTYKVFGLLFVQDDKHVFFPAGGRTYDTTFYNQDGYLGCCWSSSLKTDYIETAYCLTFSNYNVLPGNLDNRSGGLPIRPFKDIDD